MAHRYVKFVKENHGLALILADNHECALPNKAHMMWDQSMTPQEQYEYGLELFSPIVPNIIGACTGNHTGRAQKVAGIDLDKTMAERLGYLDRYSPWQGFVAVTCGKITYNISFKHGQGAGSNTFQNCVQLHRAYPSSDICAASHTHEMAETKRGFWDIAGGKRLIHPVTYINTGSLLNYPRYADEAGYAPQPKGFSIAWLCRSHRSVIVDTSGEI